MASNLKPIAQLDFSGGANLIVNPFLLSPKQAVQINNGTLDEHGSVKTRPGITLLTTSPDTVNPLYFRGILTRVNGQEFPFAIQAQSGSGSPITANVNSTFSLFGGGSTTQSITLGASDTLLVVSFHFQDAGRAVTSATYDGKPLTKIGDANATGVGSALEMWALPHPTTGSAKNLVANFSGSPVGLMSVRSFTIATGWRQVQTSTGNSTTPTLAIASNTNDLVIDAVSVDNSSLSLTAGGGQTSQYNLNAGTDRVSGSRAPGAASVTMSWSMSSAKAWIQMAVSLTDVNNKLWKTDDTPWTSVGNFLTAEITPDTVYMADKAVFMTGYTTPMSWDGTTLAAITAGVGQTVPPGAKHGIFHLGALWLWNTSASTTSLDGPSSLRASGTNDMNDWPNANQIFVSKDDGQVGMGMSPFTIVETGISPTATLILFKNYSGYQVTGVFGATTFSVQPIKSDMGCVAPRTIQFVSGFGVIRFTHKGFALYNGVEDRLISEEMRPAIFGGVNQSGLDFTNIERSWASQSQNPPLYVAACPVSGAALTRLFVYDLIRRGWTICTLPVDISCLHTYFTRSQFPIMHGGTLTGGQLYSLFDTAMDDNGTAISWSVLTRSFFAGNQFTPTYWRRAQLSFLIEPNKQITITPIIDGGERTPQIFSIPDNVPVGSDLVDYVASVDLLETAHYVQLRIEGQGQMRLRGLEFHASQKPSNKYNSRK